MFTPHHVSNVTCHASGFTYQVSCVSCHVSGVTCQVSGVFFVFFWTKWWRLCYQRGLPRLVYTKLENLAQSHTTFFQFSFCCKHRLREPLVLSGTASLDKSSPIITCSYSAKVLSFNLRLSAVGTPFKLLQQSYCHNYGRGTNTNIHSI